jgi:hypothetical protein
MLNIAITILLATSSLSQATQPVKPLLAPVVNDYRDVPISYADEGLKADYGPPPVEGAIQWYHFAAPIASMAFLAAAVIVVLRKIVPDLRPRPKG